MSENFVIHLPSNYMNKLICVECKNYLRIGPVKSKLDGDSICGKCSNNAKFSTAVHNKALNDILSLVDFPCVYANFGCIEYLPFNDSSNHEEECAFKSHYCPVDFLMCHWIGRATQIPQHYVEEHSNLFMNKPTFKLHMDASAEETGLYMLDRFPFLLKTKTSLEDGKIWLNLECISKKNVSNEMTYKLILHGPQQDGLKMILKERKVNPMSAETVFNVQTSDSVDLKSLINLLENPDELYCTMDIHIPKSIVADTQQSLRKIKCPNCRSNMSLPIYTCRQGHVTCEDCTLYNNTCELCKKNDVVFKRNLELEIISASNLLKCRWRNCQQLYDESSLRKHERLCSEKRFKCPRCYDWSGTREYLIKHFTEEHEIHPLHTSTTTIIEGDMSTYDFYVLAYGELFGCALFRSEDNEKNFSVWYYGAPSLYNNYSYHVQLRNPDTMTESKTYELVKCCATDNCYSFNLKISNAEIANYKDNFEYVFKIMEK